MHHGIYYHYQQKMTMTGGYKYQIVLEEDENPLDFHRFRSEETAIIPNAPTSVELSIGPGEEKQHKLLTLLLSVTSIINYYFKSFC